MQAGSGGFYEEVLKNPKLLVDYHHSYDVARWNWAEETHISKSCAMLKMYGKGKHVADMGSGPHCHLASRLRCQVTSFDTLVCEGVECANLTQVPASWLV